MTNNTEIVGVIILNWCNSRDTVECLKSILKLDQTDVRIVVCDNASDDNSFEVIYQWIKASEIVRDWAFITHKDGQFHHNENYTGNEHVTILQTGANLGFAWGNNIGIKYFLKHKVKPDYYWILNNDAIVATDALGHLVRRMNDDCRIGICGSRLIYSNSPNYLQAHGGAKHFYWLGVSRYIGHLAPVNDECSLDTIEAQLDYICGASMFVRASFVDQVGLMSENYFLFFEELDWAIRGRYAFRLGYAPESKVFHKRGATIGFNNDTRQTSFLSDYYLFLNQIRFTKIHFPLALPTVYITMLLQAARRILRGQTDRSWLIVKLLLGWRKD